MSMKLFIASYKNCILTSAVLFDVRQLTSNMLCGIIEGVRGEEGEKGIKQ